MLVCLVQYQRAGCQPMSMTGTAKGVMVTAGRLRFRVGRLIWKKSRNDSSHDIAVLSEQICAQVQDENNNS